MNIHITPTAAAIAALIGTGAAAIALGPLSPPPGPVAETSPSLDDLNTKLDLLVLNQSGNTEISGPFEVFTAPLVGGLTDNFSGTLIAEGRVYVDSISVQYCEVAVFDGPGNVDTSGQVSAGTWVARAHNVFSPNNGGTTEYTTTTTPVRTIVENGLYAAWREQYPSGFITIRYKLLDQGAAE